MDSGDRATNPTDPPPSSSSSSSAATATALNAQNREYAHAVLVLQTPSSDVDDQMAAMRYLQHYLQVATALPDLKRRQINQLVLDNVMGLVMNEERSSDQRKRQLVRTECFLMLASLLDSQTLFGDVKARVKEQEDTDADADAAEAAAGTETARLAGGGAGPKRPAGDGAPSSGAKPRAPSAPGSDERGSDETHYAVEEKKGSPPRGPRGPRRGGPAAAAAALASSTSKDDHHQSLLTTSQSNSVQNLLRPLLLKNQGTLTSHLPGNRRKRHLRPRPTALTDAGYLADGIVPGVDPLNWCVVGVGEGVAQGEGCGREVDATCAVAMPDTVTIGVVTRRTIGVASAGEGKREHRKCRAIERKCRAIERKCRAIERKCRAIASTKRRQEM